MSDEVRVAESSAWREVHVADDVDELMRLVGSFHDCFISVIRYDPLARAADGDENMSRNLANTDSLVLRFRFDSVDSNGEWPEVELEFFGLGKLSFEPDCRVSPLYEAHLERVGDAWAFINESSLSEEEKEGIWSINSGLCVIAEEVRWRRSGGMFWADEVRERRLNGITRFAEEQLLFLKEGRFNDFLAPWVGDAMHELGFEMDCGESFYARYGFAESDGPVRLRAELGRVDDLDVLGSGIFSAWRFWNHWAMAPMGEEDIEWFCVALERLIELCGGSAVAVGGEMSREGL